MLSTTLIPEGEEQALNDAQDILERYEHQLAAVIDGGACPADSTTVIDLSSGQPEVLRVGLGDPKKLGLE